MKSGIPLMIYNSLTRTKVQCPSTAVITLYVCGPTVYDSAHLGHGRTYTLFDAMRRVMRDVFNKEVIYAMNITDVDDKILKRSRESNVSRTAITAKYETEFFHDMARLGNERPTVVPRATQYIDEMVQFIGDLTTKGYAYSTEDGSVYLDTKKAQEIVGYPSVLGAGRSLDNESTGEAQSKDKRSESDFALWKGSKQHEGETWDAKPWGGIGRPGWHLECSAMIHQTLGKFSGDGTLAIHGGGIDLCFPHHENERCQGQLHLDSQAKVWSSIFCHTGHVTVDKTKMSKSLGNFSTLKQMLGSDVISPRQLRLLFLSSSKYSSGLEWNQGSVDKVIALDSQLEMALATIHRGESNSMTKESLLPHDIEFGHHLGKAREGVYEAFADDFDFPRVFDHLHDVCKKLNGRSTSTQVNSLDQHGRHLVSHVLETLGFTSDLSYNKQSLQPSLNDADLILDELVKFRASVRAAARTGDVKAILQACDVLRKDNPFATIQDLKDGSSIWKRKSSG